MSTYQSKILNILVKSETSGNTAIFDKKVAKRKFRKVEDLHGTVMRVARSMVDTKLLKRVGPGQFKLTAKGRKLATN